MWGVGYIDGERAENTQGTLRQPRDQQMQKAMNTLRLEGQKEEQYNQISRGRLSQRIKKPGRLTWRELEGGRQQQPSPEKLPNAENKGEKHTPFTPPPMSHQCLPLAKHNWNQVTWSLGHTACMGQPQCSAEQSLEA